MLRLDYCSHEACKYAVEHWHYSQTMPAGKMVRIGVWEHDKFIGVVLFSRGASPHLGTKFNLTQYELCELTRVALTKHETPVSRIVAIAIKLLRKVAPGLKLIISFADPQQGHVGGIYQAGNWLYTGTSPSTTEYLVDGKWKHHRSAFAKSGEHHHYQKRIAPEKHRYVIPLDKALLATIPVLPYPKTCVQGVDGDTLLHPE
jgi:hypothetical protein